MLIPCFVFQKSDSGSKKSKKKSVEGTVKTKEMKSLNKSKGKKNKSDKKESFVETTAKRSSTKSSKLTKGKPQKVVREYLELNYVKVSLYVVY